MSKLLPLAALVATAACHAAAPRPRPEGVGPAVEPARAGPARVGPVRAGPARVGIDAGHNNFHTLDGRYAPFAALLRSSGFEVRGVDGGFAAASLAGIDVLVVANAVAESEEGVAVTDAEAAALIGWIEGGGALWLIADHYPFGGAVEPLARALGVEMSNGMVGDEAHHLRGSDDPGNIVFTAGQGLADHPIVRGHGPGDAVGTVVTFVGQSLRGPANSAAILTLADTAVEMLPPDRRLASAAGRAQGVAFTRGRGRVYVSAEAGMFTEQVKPDGTPMGMNAAGSDDRRFTVNVARWLAREL